MCSDRSRRVPWFLCALALAAVACGKQGDPRPRPRAVPQPANDLALRQRGGDVLLEFAYPSATVAGLPLERIASATVYEAPVGVLPGNKIPTLREKELETAAKPVVELEGAALEEAVVGARIVTRRELPAEVLAGTEGRLYAVRTKSAAGELSPFSNAVGLRPRTPPPPPGDLEATATANGVRLSWSAPPNTMPAPPPPPPPPATPAPAPPAAPAPTGTGAATAAPAATAPAPPATAPAAAAPSAPATPATATPAAATAAPALVPASPAIPPGVTPIAGYVVLRREATNPRWGAPVATVAATAHEHLDRSARFGTRYVYTVLTLLEEKPPIESAVQSAREIDYRDVFAPTPPAELRALLVGDQVRLVWEPSPEADLAGYWIERAPADGEFRRVNERLVQGADYTDPAPAGGGDLRYRLVAVDGVGNVAPPTPTVVVARP